MDLVMATVTGSRIWTAPGTAPASPGTAPALSIEALNPGYGRAARAALLLHLFFLALLLAAAPARAEEKDATLEGSGIHYPGGFDPNTVGEVKGKAYGLFRPDRGPVRFRLETGRETYTVLTSPAWFWNDLKANLSDGTEVRVLGSKSLGKDMNLYIIAQEIRLASSGQSFVLRDEEGFPLWKGAGPMGPRGGFGSPTRGGGGTGSGPGGMGGGRR